MAELYVWANNKHTGWAYALDLAVRRLLRPLCFLGIHSEGIFDRLHRFDTCVRCGQQKKRFDGQVIEERHPAFR